MNGSAAELDGDGHGISQRRDRQADCGDHCGRQADCGDHCGRQTVSGESARAARGERRSNDDLKAAAAKSITARPSGNIPCHEAKTRCRMPSTPSKKLGSALRPAAAVTTCCPKSNI